MTADRFEQVRDKDHTVLVCIKDGQDDVQKITAATTLSKNEVNYSFSKLKDLDLITVQRPDGQVTRVIAGQKRVFDHPKQASLTPTAHQYFQSHNHTESSYRDMSHDELVERIHKLEDDINRLEQAFETFRKQVQQQL